MRALQNNLAPQSAHAHPNGSAIPLASYPTSGTRQSRTQHDENNDYNGDTSDEEAQDTKDEDTARAEAEDATMASWVGQPAIRGSTESMRMVLLTLSLIGLQFTWGIEMTYCTPYLLALGLTKSKTSLVWIAGPLSGLIMQPIIGVMSDQSRSKYGRRRPFMVVGSIIVAIGLIIMAWAKEFTSIFISTEETLKSATIVVAVLSIYAVDFAINAVQSCCRSLIVDTLPISKQQLGSAWASRMVAVGHLVGYAAGTLDLVGIFGKSLGETQFKKLVIIAVMGLLFTVGITSWAVTERVLIAGRGTEAKSGAITIMKKIITTTMNLPPRIQAICWAQFWAWIGWFPFLFYSSTWVGETYFRYDTPKDVAESEDSLGDIGRIGSMALVVFSLVTFASAFLLPFFVRSPEERNYNQRPPRSLQKLVDAVNKHKPDLLTAWFLGHFMFSGAMILAPFAESFRFATILVAFCGIPWVLGSWAPYAFLGVEVNKLSSTVTGPGSYRRLSFTPSLRSNFSASTHARRDSNASSRPSSPVLLRLDHDNDEPVASTGELSGIYFGILNIYTTLPQFVGTFISMIVFAIFEPGKSPELAEGAAPKEVHETGGVNAISICLFIGALSTLGAAAATRKVKHLYGR